MGQDNSQRLAALTNLTDWMREIVAVAYVSQTLEDPSQVSKFPSIYIVGGNGPREPMDTQWYHHQHSSDFKLYVYVKERASGRLASTLEEAIKLVVDKIDGVFNEQKETIGYDLRVSEIETDEGAIAAAGSNIALAVITVRVEFPSKDAA